MDEARRFRFLIPPFFLALSVATGLYFSDYSFQQTLKSFSTEELVALGAVAGASILPIGFFLTSVSILGLHLSARMSGLRTHEAVLPTATWEQLWPLLCTHLPQSPEWNLYGSATFDHEMLSAGVHEWIQRRWTTFNLSVHSLTAVLASHLTALSPAIRETWQWVLLTMAFAAIFGLSGFIAWCHTMRMLEFQASRSIAIARQANRPLQPSPSGVNAPKGVE
jgi:hypothetical protein